MHGLAQLHLHNKGVIYKVKFAEESDVLFNEVINLKSSMYYSTCNGIS